MDLLLIIFSLISLLSLILFWFEHRARQKDQQIKTPSANLEASITKSQAVLHSAYLKSEDIVAQAEIDAIKALAKAKMNTGNLEKEFSDSFNQQIQKAITDFDSRVNLLQQNYIDFIKKLQSQSLEATKYKDDLFDKKMADLTNRMEENISTFLEQNQKRSTQQIQMELNASRQLLDTYKANQMRIVDENILAVLERTLALVLHKNISLEDQIDLVFEALDEAKKEKFFV